MSLQGSLIVVANSPATELVEMLRASGAFPVIETNWSDAPTAFVAVKPAAVVIADAGPPPSETSARMLCLQIATAAGPLVPVVGMTDGDRDAAIPIAIPIDAHAPPERIVQRLACALRVRALHTTVTRRMESYGAEAGHLPDLPVGDPLEDATILIAGRNAGNASLASAWSDRVKLVGALNIETAAQHLSVRDIDGLIVADGFAPQMVEAFLAAAAEDPRFRDLPVGLICRNGVLPDFAASYGMVDALPAEASRIFARMAPRVRLRAQEARLNRMLKTLDTGGMFDAETGLLSADAFWAELGKAMADASRNSQSLSVARIAFEGAPSSRLSRDAARLAARVVRSIDFAGRAEDGAIVVAFTMTDLASGHLVARRLAGTLRKALHEPKAGDLEASVTLATMKATDTVHSLMARAVGAQTVAAE